MHILVFHKTIILFIHKTLLLLRHWPFFCSPGLSLSPSPLTVTRRAWQIFYAECSCLPFIIITRKNVFRWEFLSFVLIISRSRAATTTETRTLSFGIFVIEPSQVNRNHFLSHCRAQCSSEIGARKRVHTPRHPVPAHVTRATSWPARITRSHDKSVICIQVFYALQLFATRFKSQSHNRILCIGKVATGPEWW